MRMIGGYDGYSRSNRAAAAESAGRLPASKAAKILGVSTAAIRAVLTTNEWHHTSCRYNTTYYYDVADLLDLIERPDTLDDDDRAELQATLDALRAYDREHPSAIAVESYTATVSWLTWSGTRNHPVATEHRAEGVAVTQKGQWIMFTAEGRQWRKNITSNGTRVERA